LHFLHKLFASGHLLVSVFFLVCAAALLWFAGEEFWTAVREKDVRAGINGVLGAIALLTVTVAALELGQTILEEEVQREAHMSAPTRVRRFLSRFMIVLVVALSIESLVGVFRFLHEAPENLPYAASIALVAAALLAAWGLFVHLNRSAEELEPEEMQHAKEEDRKVQREMSEGG
jgi:hypothetical protein